MPSTPFWVRSLTVISLFLLGACSASRVVKPLAKNEAQVGASVGGPLVYQKVASGRANLLLPFLSVNGAYGVTDNFTIHGGWNITPIFVKTLHLDVGATYGLINPDKTGWGLSVNGDLHTFASMRDGALSILPDIGFNGYRNFGDRSYLYFGSGNAFDFQAAKSVAINTGLWRPYVHLGYGLDGERVRHQWEIKYLGFNEKGEDSIVGHYGIGGFGQWAFYYSINLRK